MVHDGTKQECREALETLRKQRARGDETLLSVEGETGLEKLHRLAPQAKSADEKLGLYAATIAALEGYGDDRGRDAWEEKLLVDFKDDQNACPAYSWTAAPGPTTPRRTSRRPFKPIAKSATTTRGQPRAGTPNSISARSSSGSESTTMPFLNTASFSKQGERP